VLNTNRNCPNASNKMGMITMERMVQGGGDWLKSITGATVKSQIIAYIAISLPSLPKMPSSKCFWPSSTVK